MRTFIVGTGATGGYFGGRLALARQDVTFVARGDHYRKICTTGLVVDSAGGNFCLPNPSVIDSISKIEDPELVLVFVKTYDTAEVARELSGVVGPDTTVITFQTGLENDLEIKKAVQAGSVFPGIAYINASRTRPGVISQTSGPCTLTFGVRGGHQNATLARVEAFLKSAEINAALSDDIEYDMWKKLVWISAFAGITVLFRSPVGRILNNMVGERLSRELLREGFAVAASQGVTLSDVDKNQLFDKIDYFKTDGRNAKTSLLLDVEGGRPTEIETMHGSLVRYARRAGMEVPLLEMIYSILKVHEAGLRNKNRLNQNNKAISKCI